MCKLVYTVGVSAPLSSVKRKPPIVASFHSGTSRHVLEILPLDEIKKQCHRDGYVPVCQYLLHRDKLCLEYLSLDIGNLRDSIVIYNIRDKGLDKLTNCN